MTLWYSSDHHFGHENIIKFCSRPFNHAPEMDEFLIDIHNQYVKPEDHWSCLGDLTMKRGGKQDQEAVIRLVKRLNGHKRLFLGNHDHLPIKTYLEAGFEKIYATWRFDGILFSHIPVHPSSMGTARANVHGHIHNSQAWNAFPPVMSVDKTTQKVTTRPYINISVEVTDYRPLSLEEINQRIKKAGGK